MASPSRGGLHDPFAPPFDRILRRIGSRLRDLYAPIETEALPIEHVDLLLRLRHRERDRERARSQ